MAATRVTRVPAATSRVRSPRTMTDQSPCMQTPRELTGRGPEGQPSREAFEDAERVRDGVVVADLEALFEAPLPGDRLQLVDGEPGRAREIVVDGSQVDTL